MAEVKILCPKCDWEPSPDDMWQCTCGHVWHTFDTAGRCPGCGKQWEETCCHSPAVGGCGRWSPHLDWYRHLDRWLQKEINKVRVKEEA